ncbi:MAG TPA: WhiB family transcriptional regulator [Actinomycetota bacterium]|nr:WhiB family transcriptional regulator [Actinomycetota bacterium]
MPGEFRLQRVSPSVVPSVLDAIFGRGRSWVRDALCAQPPYDEWNFIPESSGSYGASLRHAPSTVVSAFEVCAGCPVRRQCLLDALGEEEFTVTGGFGGTTTAERRAALNEVAGELADEPRPIELGRDDRRTYTSAARTRRLTGHNSIRRYGIDRTRLAEMTADRLEASFERRLRRWRALQHAKPRNKASRVLLR